MPTKKRSLPRITPKQFVAERNDEMRSALIFLGRKVLPHLDVQHSYITDLVHDALHLAEMNDGDTVYLHLTDVGTHLSADLATLRDLTQNIAAPRAVLKITCTKPQTKYLTRHWACENLTETAVIRPV